MNPPDTPHTTASGQRRNEHWQPIGASINDWVAPPKPPPTHLTGRFVDLVPADADAHAAALFEAFDDPAGWTYLFNEPFDDTEALAAWMDSMSDSDDVILHTIVVEGQPVGFAAYLRITPAMGSIEVGSVHFGTALQRTPAATEAMFLMMQRAFDLGYRRYEWKCDALNAPSRAAARRLGFSFEGIFRQAIVYKGRNRDTAWFSITDTEWPTIRSEFRRWLAPSNFDTDGVQRTRLDTLAH